MQFTNFAGNVGKQIDLATFSGELNPRPREFPAMSNSALIFTQFCIPQTAYCTMHFFCLFVLHILLTNIHKNFPLQFVVVCHFQFRFIAFAVSVSVSVVFSIFSTSTFFFTFRLHKFNGTPGWGSAFGVRWGYGYIRYYIPTKLLLTVLIRKAHEMPVRLRMRHFFFAQLHR